MTRPFPDLTPGAFPMSSHDQQDVSTGQRGDVGYDDLTWDSPIVLPAEAGRGLAGQVIDAAWPEFGGNNAPAEFWNAFGLAVRFTLAALANHPLKVGEREGWKLVPVEPTEEMWSGLARQIVMWSRGSRPTGLALHRDLKNSGWPIPDWLGKEIENADYAPPKGCVSVAIYRAMIAAAPTPTEATPSEGAEAAIAQLERELGVQGTANVFREALRLAKEARAEVLNETARPVGEDALREKIAQTLYEHDHRGLRDCWAWDADGLEAEHPGTHERYERAAGAILPLVAALASPTQQAPDQGGVLLSALKQVNKLVAEAAARGFNHADGDWVGRLFASQADTFAAIRSVEPSYRGLVPATPKANTGEA